MGREWEEGLIRTHQREAPKKKGALRGAQGLVNQILKRELQPSG